MRRSEVEQKIDILRMTVQNPEWSSTRIMNTANITPTKHNEFLSELVDAGLVSVKTTGEKGVRTYLTITDDGLECVRKWDDLIKTLGGK